MDDPIVGSSVPLRLRRLCERNRLEKQFMVDAYERLVPVIENKAFCGGSGDEWGYVKYRVAKKRSQPLPA